LSVADSVLLQVFCYFRCH